MFWRVLGCGWGLDGCGVGSGAHTGCVDGLHRIFVSCIRVNVNRVNVLGFCVGGVGDVNFKFLLSWLLAQNPVAGDRFAVRRPLGQSHRIVGCGSGKV